MRRILWIVVFVLLFALPLSAQENTTPDTVCDETGKQQVADLFTQLGEQFVTMEEADLNTALIQAQAMLQSYRARCNGLTFTSEEYGEDVVTDPIIFRDGSYRVTLESESITSVTIETFEGDCDLFGLIQVFDMEGGSEQELFTFEECVAILDVDSSGAWTLVFEPITQ